MSPQPEKLQRTPLKEDIERRFVDVCEISTMLNGLVNCSCPGNKDAIFRRFASSFERLFRVTRYKKGLSTDTITKCDKWFTTQKRGNVQNIDYGQKLFTEYSKELFNQGMIIYG
jgi:hypothetical protein